MSRAELERQRSSMVNIRVGNRTLPAYRSNRCKVCTHPGRPLIEEQILLNSTYPSIVEWVSNHEVEEIDGALVEWPTVTVNQLLNHYNNGHCPLDAKLLHELSEQRMTELGLDYESSTGRIVDHVVTAKLIAAMGQERLMRGEIQPDVKDTLAASKLLADLDSKRGGAEGEELLVIWQQAMEVFFTVTQRHVSGPQWQAIGADLSSNPVLRELTARMQATEDDITDAELVE